MGRFVNTKRRSKNTRRSGFCQNNKKNSFDELFCIIKFNEFIRLGLLGVV